MSFIKRIITNKYFGLFCIGSLIPYFIFYIIYITVHGMEYLSFSVERINLERKQEIMEICDKLKYKPHYCD